MPGCLDGRYQLQEEVGRGGMGVVHRAVQVSLNRVVAIKFLSAHLRKDPKAWRRFITEAESVSRMTHPNIIRLFDVQAEADPPYLVTEWLPGGNLEERLEKEGPFGTERVADLGRQLQSALVSLHEQRILHRDLKPANVLLRPSGEAVLTDFGLARQLDTPSMTTEGIVMGTWCYLAPEQLRGEPATGKTDIYQLGLLLYELLAGRPLWDRDTPALVRVSTDTPRAVLELDPALEGWPERLARALTGEPEDREWPFDDEAEGAGYCAGGERKTRLVQQRVAPQRESAGKLSAVRRHDPAEGPALAAVVGGLLALLALGGCLMFLFAREAPPPKEGIVRAVRPTPRPPVIDIAALSSTPEGDLRIKLESDRPIRISDAAAQGDGHEEGGGGALESALLLTVPAARIDDAAGLASLETGEGARVVVTWRELVGLLRASLPWRAGASPPHAKDPPSILAGSGVSERPPPRAVDPPALPGTDGVDEASPPRAGDPLALALERGPLLAQAVHALVDALPEGSLSVHELYDLRALCLLAGDARRDQPWHAYPEECRTFPVWRGHPLAHFVDPADIEEKDITDTLDVPPGARVLTARFGPFICYRIACSIDLQTKLVDDLKHSLFGTQPPEKRGRTTLRLPHLLSDNPSSLQRPIYVLSVLSGVRVDDELTVQVSGSIVDRIRGTKAPYGEKARYYTTMTYLSIAWPQSFLNRRPELKLQLSMEGAHTNWGELTLIEVVGE